MSQNRRACIHWGFNCRKLWRLTLYFSISLEKAETGGGGRKGGNQLIFLHSPYFLFDHPSPHPSVIFLPLMFYAYANSVLCLSAFTPQCFCMYTNAQIQIIVLNVQSHAEWCWGAHQLSFIRVVSTPLPQLVVSSHYAHNGRDVAPSTTTNPFLAFLGVVLVMLPW